MTKGTGKPFTEGSEGNEDCDFGVQNRFVTFVSFCKSYRSLVTTSSGAKMQRNDEAPAFVPGSRDYGVARECRMTKECQNRECGRSSVSAIRRLIIRHSFELRHSDFVIVPVVTFFLRPALLLRDQIRRNRVCAVANKTRRSRSAPAPQPGQREKLPATQTWWRSPG